MKSIKNAKYIILIVLVLILVYLLIKMKEQFFTITEGKISNKFTILNHIANINNQANLLIIEQLKKDLKLVKEIESLFVEQDKTNRKGAVIKNIEKLSDTKLEWTTDNILTNKDTIIDEILKGIYNNYKLVNTSDPGNIVFTKNNIDVLDTKLTTYTNTLDLDDFTKNINEYLTEYDNLMVKKTTDWNGIIAVQGNTENIETYLIEIFGSTVGGTKKNRDNYRLPATFNTRKFYSITGSITAILDTPLLDSTLDSILIELYKKLYKEIFKFDITIETKLRNVLENYNGDIQLFLQLKRLLVREKEIISKGQELYEQYALDNSGSSGSEGLSIGPEDTPYFNFPNMESLHKVDLERHFFWSNYTIEQEFDTGNVFPDFTAGNEELANVKYLKQEGSLNGSFENKVIKFNFPNAKIILIGSILIEKENTVKTDNISVNLLIPKTLPLKPEAQDDFDSQKSGTIRFATADDYKTRLDMTTENIEKGYYKPLLTNKEDYIIYNKDKEKDTSATLTFAKADDKYLIVFEKNNMLKLENHKAIYIKIYNDNTDGIRGAVSTKNRSNHKVTLNYIEIGGDEPVKTIGKLMNLNRNVLQYKYQILTNYLQCKAHGFDPNQPKGKKCNLADDTLGPYDIDSRFVNLLNPNVVQKTNNNEGEGMDGVAAMAERERILDLLTEGDTSLEDRKKETSIVKYGSIDKYTVQEIRDIL